MPPTAASFCGRWHPLLFLGVRFLLRRKTQRSAGGRLPKTVWLVTVSLPRPFRLKASQGADLLLAVPEQLRPIGLTTADCQCVSRSAPSSFVFQSERFWQSSGTAPTWSCAALQAGTAQEPVAVVTSLIETLRPTRSGRQLWRKATSGTLCVKSTPVAGRWHHDEASMALSNRIQ